jgi:CheY-like chemotaxis protein
MPKKILTVEDDKLLRESLAAMLRTQGHEVLEAVDGQEGLNVALAEHPDLVITDVRMPNMLGTEMVSKLREDDWGKQVPVIILSNDETTGAINQALQSGVTVYLSKPELDPETLSQQISVALGS